MNKPLIIALNGPIGIGKSWLLQQINNLAPIEKTYLWKPIQLVETGPSLVENVLNFYGIDPTIDYTDFKKSQFEVARYGATESLTGRDLLIEYLDTQRLRDSTFPACQLAHKTIQYITHRNAKVVVYDNIGTPSEYKAFKQTLRSLLGAECDMSYTLLTLVMQHKHCFFEEFPFYHFDAYGRRVTESRSSIANKDQHTELQYENFKVDEYERCFVTDKEKLASQKAFESISHIVNAALNS